MTFTKYLLIVLIVAVASVLCGYFRAEAKTVQGKWWYSYNPEIVGVNPNTGEMKANFKGTAVICSQKSMTSLSNTQCYTVTVKKVTK